MRPYWFIILLLIPSVVFAASVELQWGGNTENDLAGYKIYYKQSDGVGFNVYSTVIVRKGPTTVNGVVRNLIYSRKHLFVVTAYNDAGLESAYSNIVAVGFPEAKVKAKKGRYRVVTIPITETSK